MTELTPTAITAFNGGYVDLSWSTPARRRNKSFYNLLKNDQFLVKLASGVNTYHDTAMTSGATYTYKVLLVY